MVIITISGTRSTVKLEQIESLLMLLKQFKPSKIIHGDCIGFDNIAHIVVKSNLPKCKIEIYPSNIGYRAYCNGDIIHKSQPPLKRNKIMVGDGDFLIAGVKTENEILRSGTWSTIRYAKKVNKTVYIIYPNGTIKNV